MIASWSTSAAHRGTTSTGLEAACMIGPVWVPSTRAPQRPVAARADDQQVGALAVAGHAVDHRAVGEAPLDGQLRPCGVGGALQRASAARWRIASMVDTYPCQPPHIDATAGTLIRRRAASAWRAMRAATRAMRSLSGPPSTAAAITPNGRRAARCA